MSSKMKRHAVVVLSFIATLIFNGILFLPHFVFYPLRNFINIILSFHSDCEWSLWQDVVAHAHMALSFFLFAIINKTSSTLNNCAKHMPRKWTTVLLRSVDMRYNEFRRMVYRFSFMCAMSIFVFLIYYQNRSGQYMDEVLSPLPLQPPSALFAADTSIDKIRAGM
jgi:hypothetical protein